MARFGNIVYDYYLKYLTPHTRMYPIRGNKYDDLRKFCKRQMFNKTLIKLSESFMSSDLDKTVIAILRFVKQRTRYESDRKLWRINEYWQDAITTFNNQSGDCEDGAILILTLARLAGVPSNRIFLRCGDVSYRNSKTGHAYVVYRANDGSMYYLDWCYFYSGVRIPNRKSPSKYAKKYLTRWFDVNDNNAWK